jgi:hypothetical protein
MLKISIKAAIHSADESTEIWCDCANVTAWMCWHCYYWWWLHEWEVKRTVDTVLSN